MSRFPGGAIVIEGVVIVGSILLAFGIDAWWDDHLELAEEQRYLAGLDAFCQGPARSSSCVTAGS